MRTAETYPDPDQARKANARERTLTYIEPACTGGPAVACWARPDLPLSVPHEGVEEDESGEPFRRAAATPAMTFPQKEWPTRTTSLSSSVSRWATTSVSQAVRSMPAWSSRLGRRCR